MHLSAGGVAVFAPDCVRETFRPNTEHGGHDGDGRSLSLPDLDVTILTPPTRPMRLDFTYVIREGDECRARVDRHVEGLFGQEVWLRLLAEVGFAATIRPLVHSEVEPGETEVFVAVRPG